MIKPTQKILIAIAMLLGHLKNNFFEYLMLAGFILVGLFLFNVYGLNAVFLYAGILFVVIALIAGFLLPSPKQNK